MVNTDNTNWFLQSTYVLDTTTKLIGWGYDCIGQIPTLHKCSKLFVLIILKIQLVFKLYKTKNRSSIVYVFPHFITNVIIYNSTLIIHRYFSVHITYPVLCVLFGPMETPVKLRNISGNISLIVLNNTGMYL